MFKILPKKVWIPTLIAVIIVLVGGVLAYQYWWLPKEEAKNFLEQTSIAKNAISTSTEQDLSICGERQDQNEKAGCYSAIALAKNDPSICDKLQNQTGKDMCYYLFVTSRPDPTICEKIQAQWEKDSCYSIVAESDRGV